MYKTSIHNWHASSIDVLQLALWEKAAKEKETLHHQFALCIWNDTKLQSPPHLIVSMHAKYDWAY